MITPNKFISFSESSLGHVDRIYNAFEDRALIRDLYKKLSGSFGSIDLFMYAIEVLYIAGVLEVDFNSGMVSKC